MVVGAIGFEPTTCGSQNRRAARLRYAPLGNATTRNPRRIEASAFRIARPCSDRLFKLRMSHLSSRIQAKLAAEASVYFEYGADT